LLQIVGSAAEMKVQRSKSSELPVVHIDVPPGQLEVGRQLLRCMYEQQPRLSSIDPQTLQLLLLADKYGVPAVMAAVAKAFSGASAEQLPWDVVTAVYSLPAAYAEHAALVEVHAAVADKLQHDLGDLELLFADRQGQKQQQLKGLLHAAMQQLLRDERTRVASENTAAHAVLVWAAAQEGGVSDKQVLLLVSQDDWITRCLGGRCKAPMAPALACSSHVHCIATPHTSNITLHLRICACTIAPCIG
jgi:hypothetical protein